jgi:hypothetical protein
MKYKVRVKAKQKYKVRVRAKEEKRKFPRNSPVMRKTGASKRPLPDYWNIPGMWTVQQLAKTNPHCQKMVESLFALSRDELAARLALIYTAILGLTGMERE